MYLYFFVLIFIQRGLCCFPGLKGKKPIQSLLADEVSVLSTNNSDPFLQKLAHIDQLERERNEKIEQDQNNTNRTDEIVLLEKQGRSSQKMRNNAMGNLVQVSQSVGQNMTDISNIANSNTKVLEKVTSLTQNLTNITQNSILPSRNDRGASLPPSALPRPPRSLNPPRKIDYDRLSDSKFRKRLQTPPNSSANRAFELKTSSLKRGEYGKQEYSPSTNYSIKQKNYGTINQKSEMNTDFKHKLEYPSIKNYQHLDDSNTLKMFKESSPSLKRSLLPSARTRNTVKTPRDSVNSASSSSKNSNNSRSSPVHIRSDSNTSNIFINNTGQYHHSRTPPKYIRLTPPPDELIARNFQLSVPDNKSNHSKLHSPTRYNASLPSASNTASLPPKPADLKTPRSGNSISRGENRYRIQF